MRIGDSFVMVSEAVNLGSRRTVHRRFAVDLSTPQSNSPADEKVAR
jgi:hypothetical protein